MMADMNISKLKGVSRKVHVKEGESDDIIDDGDSSSNESKGKRYLSATNNTLVDGSDSNIFNNMSKTGSCNQLKNKIKTCEVTLKTLELIKEKREEGGALEEGASMKDVLSSNMDEKEAIDGGGEGFAFTINPITGSKKEIRCIQAFFEVVVIDKTNSFGTLLFGEDFRERHWMFLSDPRSIFAFLSVLGACLSFSGVAAALPSYYGVFSLVAIPSLLIVFMAMNIPLFKLLAFRFFTILKSVYIFIFVISGVILSRERENSWAINITFIMCGITMFLWGLFGDCFYIAFRVMTMQRSSITISILLSIFIVLLHTGSLNVSDSKLEFMGHFNFSVLSLMSSALNTLFLLNLEIVYVAFMDPTRLVTLYCPITNRKVMKGVTQMMRSAAKASEREESLSAFPPTLTSTDDKIKYIKDQLEMLKTKLSMLYADLTDDEKQEVDNYSCVAKRETEMLTDRLKILIQSSGNKEEVDAIISTFPLQEIDSENTLGKWLFGPKTAKVISKFGLFFQFMWIIGMIFTLLAINKIIDDVYALAVFFCLPTLSNLFLLNILILKQLVFHQFETLVVAISSFIFCLCGAVLVREREYSWSYFFFFSIVWLCGHFINFSDSLPGSKRYLNVVVGSLSGLTVYFTLLVGVFVDKLEGQDFVIPMFGSLNITISNQCANAGFTCVIFLLRNLLQALMYPDQLVVLQGRLYFSKMMMSEVQMLQGINKVALQVNKSQKKINSESV